MKENGSRTNLLTSGLAIVLCFGLLSDGQVFMAQAGPLMRRYRVGEPIQYTMQAINEGPLRTVHYEAVADGKVTCDSLGNFVEEFARTRLSVNGQLVG